MRAVIGLVLIAACEGGGTTPAATDGGAMSDTGSDPAFALRVAWSADPALPGPVSNSVEVTEATFRVLRLQVIGDASGGEATTARQLELAWGGPSGDPPPTVFPQAPAGLYSQVAFDLDSQQGMAYEISGFARIGGVLEPFHIVDTQELAISIAGFGVMLEPGEAAEIPVVLELARLLSRVNFTQLPVIEGVRELDESSAQIQQLREDLAAAFAPVD